MNSEAYRIRSEEYTLNYFHQYLESKTPQELILSFSDLPSVVQKLRYCTDKLKHLSKKDKSEIVALKELRETMKKLKLSKSKESRDQQKILAASVSSLEFGVPQLGLHPRVEKEALLMKRQLISGEKNVLKCLDNEKRQVFLREVKEVAIKHWEEITVTEPGKHKRLTKAVKDGEETAPVRYQTMTNEETFESFKDNCSNDVKVAMEKYAQERLAAYRRRPESEDKEYRLKYAKNVLPNKFPSQSWWLEQRPKEVKPMHNHTMGLCKVKSLYYKI